MNPEFNPVEAFERVFEEWNGSPFARAVNNGSSAIFAGLKALGLPYLPGGRNRIITSPFTFPATANMIIAAGFKPVFCDIDPDTLLLDPQSVEEAIIKKRHVLAIVIPQLFGRIADMDAFLEIQVNHGVRILEDASQALGAKRNGVKAGNFFDVGTYSFFATKNLWTYEGGMVVTPDGGIAHRVEMLRNHGMYEDKMIMMGYNLKMPWLLAFQGWQMVKMHKTAILSELGTQGPEKHRDIYGRLVYQHIWYDHNPDAWSQLPCPNAEEAARRLRE